MPKNFIQLSSKILAVGRNYADHAKELGNKPAVSAPILFLKPPSSYLSMPDPVVLPQGATVNHEVELGVVIGRRTKAVSKSTAMDHVAGYCLALDMTARNFQVEAAKNGLPWTVSKGYDTFTPVSQFLPSHLIQDPHRLTLWCKVDGKVRQRGSTKNMIFDIPALIAYASKIMTFEEGDLLLTGTPAGVGPVEDGQVIECGLENADSKTLTKFKFRAVRAAI